jgi:nucleoside-diphosphate-sugar epimerase
MHLILGDTGHVGSAAAMSLLQQGEAVAGLTALSTPSSISSMAF